MRTYRDLIATMIAFAMTLLIPADASAQIAVFDSASYGQLVTTVSTATSQLSELEQQLNTQLSMIRALPSDVLTAAGITQLAGATQGLMTQISSLETEGTNLTNTLNSLYPTNFSNLNTVQGVIDQLASMRANTNSAYSNAMAIQAQVAANQPTVSAEINAANGESMSAAGTTGVLQATNHMLGAISQQLGDEQSLLASAFRTQEENDLNNQSESAAAQQGGINSITPYSNTGGSISNPFSDVGN